MDPDAVDNVVDAGVWEGQYVVTDGVAVSWGTEGRAACCDFLDTAFAGFDDDVFRVYEDSLEREEVVAGDAGTHPAIVLVDASRRTQDFADNVLKVPVRGAAVLEAKVGLHVVEAMGCVADGRIAVNQASHR